MSDQERLLDLVRREQAGEPLPIGDRKFLEKERKAYEAREIDRLLRRVPMGIFRTLAGTQAGKHRSEKEIRQWIENLGMPLGPKLDGKDTVDLFAWIPWLLALLFESPERNAGTGVRLTQAHTCPAILEILHRSGASAATAEQVQADITAGAPINEDGTMNLIEYAAWLAGRNTHGR